MRHPLEIVIAPDQRRNVFVTFLALTLIFGGIIYHLNADLVTDKAGQGIVSFQLAGDPLVSQIILNSWALKPGSAQTIVILDYAFLLLYSTTLALACVWASKLWTTSVLASLGVWVAWGQWAAALSNAIQDFALLRILQNTQGPAPAQLATQAARDFALVKFGLIEAGLLYVTVSGYAAAVNGWLWRTHSSSVTQAQMSGIPKAG